VSTAPIIKPTTAPIKPTSSAHNHNHNNNNNNNNNNNQTPASAPRVDETLPRVDAPLPRVVAAHINININTNIDNNINTAIGTNIDIKPTTTTTFRPIMTLTPFTSTTTPTRPTPSSRLAYNINQNIQHRQPLPPSTSANTANLHFYPGEYYIKIYEQQSTSNLNPALSFDVVYETIMNVVGTNQNIPTSYSGTPDIFIIYNSDNI
jgi:hypothetical protein